ncbi:MAG TPA: hypothetical protein VN577_08700 [Terriglobales bacterium]|nr:hypothetical protein [Terriglobales bacterium]
MNTLETNIRIVTPGPSLYLNTRRLRLQPRIDSPELLQKVAGRVGLTFNTACIPYGDQVIVALSRPIQPVRLEFEDFATDLSDAGALQLNFAIESDRDRLATLVERRLYATVPNRTDWWRDGQFHSWYEKSPITVLDGIAAFRRYSASAVVLDGVGIGIAVDVTTTFLTTGSVADYLLCSDPGQRTQFERLSSRKSGYKGTLLYDLGTSKHKCYFDQFCHGLTCGTTGPLRIKGTSYDSLYDYVTRMRGANHVQPNDPVARVSFPGIDRPQLVPAKRLFVRVGTEQLRGKLKEVDKLSPEERRQAISQFWKVIGTDSLGAGMPQVTDHFWQPTRKSIFLIPPPALELKGETIEPPIERSQCGYRKWFVGRLPALGRGKAYYVPPTAPRTIYFVAPTRCSSESLKALGEAICRLMSQWAGIRFTPFYCQQYGSLEEGIARLERIASSGIAVFVFDDDNPAAYFEIEYGLKAWRVKRITARALSRHFDEAKDLIQPAQPQNGNGHRAMPKPLYRWDNFIRVCALDVFQKLGALPWRYQPTGGLEAELSIDVGADRRQFAVSLLVNRDVQGKPEFCLETVTEWKADVKHETINPEALKASVIKVFRSAPIGTPLNSVVVFRDGTECGDERQAVAEAFENLKVEKKLSAAPTVVFTSVRKTGTKNIRIWELSRDGVAVNTLEGVAIRLRAGARLLCTTGAACLTQGTADPLLLMSEKDSLALDEATEHFFRSAQLNYGSPGVAQRLAAGLKRTDEELRARAAQEIRRIK